MQQTKGKVLSVLTWVWDSDSVIIVRTGVIWFNEISSLSFCWLDDDDEPDIIVGGRVFHNWNIGDKKKKKQTWKLKKKIHRWTCRTEFLFRGDRGSKQGIFL